MEPVPIMPKFTKGDIVIVSQSFRKKTYGLKCGVVSAIKFSGPVPIYDIILPLVNGMRLITYISEVDLQLQDVKEAIQ